MFSKEYSVDINAPVEQVFAYVTDIKRHPEWSNNKMTMVVQGEPVAAGTTFHAEISAFGKEFSQGNVVEVTPPARFVYECDNKSSGFWRWTMTLTPVAGGTRLSHKAEALRLPGWFKVMLAVMHPFVGKKMHLNGLANIKARVEAGAGLEAAA